MDQDIPRLIPATKAAECADGRGDGIAPQGTVSGKLVLPRPMDHLRYHVVAVLPSHPSRHALSTRRPPRIRLSPRVPPASCRHTGARPAAVGEPMKRFVMALLAVALLGGAAVVRGARAVGVLHDVARAQPARVFGPRLSIDAEYRPCARRPPPAGGTLPGDDCGAAGDVPERLDSLAAGVESADPDSLQASALAAVIWWDERHPSMDAAIDRLLKALPLSPHRASLLVDLSGVHLVRAQRTQNPRDLVAGLEYALQALEHGPGNAPALYNVALALESLAIDGQAARAWDAYLAVDSTTGWAAEARERRRVLRQPRPAPRTPTMRSGAVEVEGFAARHPQEARLLGWDSVLGEWGGAVLEGNAARADSLLGFAERLGAALERRQGGDATLADAVRAIHAARGDEATSRTLARAHRAYAAGQARFAEPQVAQDSFEIILRLAAPSPVLIAWTHAFHAGTLVYDTRNAEASAALGALLSRTNSRRHPALAARAHWMRGTALIRMGEHSAAREAYRAAAEGLLRLGEAEYYGATRYLDGEATYKSGDTPGGYRKFHEALVALRPYDRSVWLHNVLLELAGAAAKEGMERAAARIQDEGVAVAMRVNRPAVAPEALLARARVRALMGDTAGALRDLTAAAPLIETVKDGERREQLTNILRFSRTLIRSRGTIPAAQLDSAVSFFAEINVVWLMQTLMARADLHLASGNLAAALADLDGITARIRRMSEREPDFHLRAAMIEQARIRFDQLVMLHAGAGRPVEALRALERGRISFGPARGGRSPEDGRLSAPAGHVAVEYALIGDALLTWTVRGDSVSLLRRMVHRDSLLLAIERAGAALETPGGDALALPQLERLYDWLIRPVEGRLGPTGTPLVVLADGEIARVPFGALRDARRGGRYLVQDHASRFASSLADAARPARPGRSGSALLVADPAFHPLDHPTLGRLPGAAAEVRSLEAVYPGARSLAGDAATVRALLGHARGVSVIHYAGHAIFDDTRPERSFLVLAGRGEAGRLSAEGLRGLELGGVRLVVLSACRTVRSRQGRSGGFAGLSGSLLAAGVGGVVGNLWEVGDRRTLQLMTAFHGAYRDSDDPAAALRQAQLHMLRSPDAALRSPAAWAGFRYVGR